MIGDENESMSWALIKRRARLLATEREWAVKAQARRDDEDGVRDRRASVGRSEPAARGAAQGAVPAGAATKT